MAIPYDSRHHEQSIVLMGGGNVDGAEEPPARHSRSADCISDWRWFKFESFYKY